jgi:hypothetical protein
MIIIRYILLIYFYKEHILKVVSLFSPLINLVREAIKNFEGEIVKGFFLMRQSLCLYFIFQF